jgi:hypothetical protein
MAGLEGVFIVTRQSGERRGGAKWRGQRGAKPNKAGRDTEIIKIKKEDKSFYNKIY